MNREIFIVTGETGVGKDFLVDRANVPPAQINRANWGDLFSDLANADKDRLSHELYRPGEDATEVIQRLVCQQVIDLQPAIVTSHPVKILDGEEHVNWEIEEEISPRCYFVVQAAPELIRERVINRNASGVRKSKVLTLEELTEYQGRKLELTEQLANHVGADLVVLRNDDEHTEESIRILYDAISGLTTARS